MSVTRADTKRRVVLPGARAGDVFDVQRNGEEQYVLVRLKQPEIMPVTDRLACLEAMSRSPLRMTLTWEQLRQVTREP